MKISRKQFKEQWRPRFGTANPERMSCPFWEWMILGKEVAADPEPDDEESLPGFYPQDARDRFGVSYDRAPIWTFQRMGMSRTTLPDGTTIYIAGEHKDFYDPDFNIYNDVIVFRPDGSLEIYGYPRDVFPPTDFHSATLVDDRIIVIGSVGYQGERAFRQTQVYALHLSDMHMEKVETRGEMPGWISKHEAELVENVVNVRGGTLCEMRDQEVIRKNFDTYTLDLITGIWTRTTHNPWLQFSIHDEENQTHLLGDREIFSMALRNAGQPDLIASYVFLKLDDCRPRDIQHSVLENDDPSTLRILVDGIPVSISNHAGEFEIVIEGKIAEARAKQLVEGIVASIAAATGLRYIIELKA